MSTNSHPVIVVTGANSGVGFGICHRLLVQLSRSFPDDALPRAPSTGEKPQDIEPSPFAPAQHLSLVLACRSPERAAAARQRLLKIMDAEVLRQKKIFVPGGCAEVLRRGLRIEFIPLDLASMDSIFDFAEEFKRRYTYITHLVLNAGYIALAGLHWPTVFKQLFTDPLGAITTPRFLTQRVSEESRDGLGLVWQCNVFGHYSLFRLLEPLLLRNPCLDSRVQWMSSLDALPEDYDPSDPQLRRTEFNYQASKYQVDLICAMLARRASQKSRESGTARIRHLLVQPGVCSTNVVYSVVGVYLEALKVLIFYVVRMFGSKNHPIKPYKGAAAAGHAALAPGPSVDAALEPPQKYGSRASAWGKDYVELDPVLEWKCNIKTAEDLLETCEKFLTLFEQRRGATSIPLPNDSGIIID